jgi:hypothetical protein
VYVYLGVSGTCIFNLDGRVVMELFPENSTVPDENIFLAFENSTLLDTPHVLTIYPLNPGRVIQFDYLIYTCVLQIFIGLPPRC